MGTSSSFAGTPKGASLIPAFLNDDEDDIVAPAQPPGEPEENGDAVPLQFADARADFTRWVTAGAELPQLGVRRRRGTVGNAGANSALPRSLGRYTRDGLKGSARAADRMVRASGAAAATIGTLRDIQARGLNAVLRELRLDALVGRPPRELFAAIIDVVCDRMESIDDDIAREALLDSLLVVGENELFDFDNLNEAQIAEFYAHFVCKAIERRYLADVSSAGRTRAISDNAYAQIDSNVGRIIEISVHARVQQAIRDRLPLNAAFTETTMREVFEAAWRILESFADGD